MTTMSHGYCKICDKHNPVLVPLHDDKGGPLVCLPCAGSWHAKHARRRKAGRIVIRALKAYEEAGGNENDVIKLRMSVVGLSVGLSDFDPLGYMADAVDLKGGCENVDLTSELLDDIIKLVHPDCHRPERQELAHRVTQSLLALKPFVFPALKPKAVAPAQPQPPRNESVIVPRSYLKKPLRYPCKECASELPCYYCDWCKAEWNRRQEDERKKENAQQRKWYAQRRDRRQRAKPCAQCGEPFKGKRKDAKFCSDTCRQAAHRGTPAAITFETKAKAELRLKLTGLK
jgi:hypothetical protein